MKTVFSNDMVAHVFAQRSQDRGQSPNGAMFFERNTIYSYGYHFPLATFIESKQGGTQVLINSSSYSNTTSKHQSITRQALRQYGALYAPNEIVKLCIQYNKMFFVDGATKYLERVAIDRAKASAQRSIARTKQREIDNALAEYKTVEALFTFYGLKIPAKTKKLFDVLQRDAGKVTKTHELAEKKAAQKRLKEQEAAKAMRLQEATMVLPSWIADSGKDDVITPYRVTSLLRDLPFAELRVRGAEIETSQGAKFPLAHAVKAWPIIKAIKESGKEWHRNGHTIHLGHFQIDKVDASGNVTAGCHYVKYESIERVAKELGLV